MATAATAVALVAPGSASALSNDTYVNDDAPAGTHSCTSVNPCRTIRAAVSDTNFNGVVHIDGGDYLEAVTVSNNVSLRRDDFDTADGDCPTAPCQSIVDGANQLGPGITVDSGGAGVIQGLVIRGVGSALSLRGPVVGVLLNRFDLVAFPSAMVTVGPGADGFNIRGNRFQGNPGTDYTGILVTGASGEIANNHFDQLRYGVKLGRGGGRTLAADNLITGIHTGSGSDGAGIVVSDSGASPELAHNRIETAAAGTSGVVIADATPGDPFQTGATLLRNFIDGRGFASNGVVTNNTPPGAVTLDGDLITDAQTGLLPINGGGAGSGQGNVSLTNVTLAGNATDISSLGADISLDSTIVEDPITVAGTVTCSIAFSRGPSTAGTSCEGFQTSAAPGFVDPAAGDFHLLPSSPLIDVGNPASPTSEFDTLDGDARAVLGTAGCTPRRDIGADEFVPATPIAPSCPTSQPALPASSPPPSSGPTGQRAAALRKCKKKRSSKARKKCRKRAKRLPV